MSDLIAITFESREAAQEVREEFARMHQEFLVEVEDSVVAYRNRGGQLRLDQTLNLTAIAAGNGLFWGFLVGALVAIPTGGAVVPVVAAAAGTGLGALSGATSDFGIDDGTMKRLAEGLEDGATLFVLVRNPTLDKILQHLRPYEGRVLRTSLPDDVEARLQNALQAPETR